MTARVSDERLAVAEEILRDCRATASADAVRDARAEIVRMREALGQCREQFDILRGDWSDNRGPCRAGWAIIDAALAGGGGGDEAASGQAASGDEPRHDRDGGTDLLGSRVPRSTATPDTQAATPPSPTRADLLRLAEMAARAGLDSFGRGHRPIYVAEAAMHIWEQERTKEDAT